MINSAELSSSHACTICNIEFDLRFDLRSHMQQHHNQKKVEKKPLEIPKTKVKDESEEVKKKAKVDGKAPSPGLKKEKKIPIRLPTLMRMVGSMPTKRQSTLLTRQSPGTTKSTRRR